MKLCKAQSGVMTESVWLELSLYGDGEGIMEIMKKRLEKSIEVRSW